MTELFEKFARLTEACSPSGSERGFLDAVRAEAVRLCDSADFDRRGNLVCVKRKAGAKKLLLAAHADTVGVMTGYADDKGFYRFSVIGGTSAEALLYRRVRFDNGAVGVIVPEAGTEKPELSKLVLDVGASDRQEAEETVPPCSFGTAESKPEMLGKRVVSRTLDDKIGCLILLELMKNVKNSAYELYFCFTVEEELGLRGARTVGYDIQPDEAIAVDVSPASDFVGSKRENIVLGGGAAIKVLDVGCVCDRDMVERLKQSAKTAGVKYQLDVADKGRTDAAELQFVRGGVRSAVISVPTRYIHTPNEVADFSDAEAVIKTLEEYIAGTASRSGESA